MTIRAKFKVSKIELALGSVPGPVGPSGKTEYTTGELRSIYLAPVYGNGDPEHENTKFWQATPTGEIRLGVVNPAAGQAFELGAEYYVDFTKAGE